MKKTVSGFLTLLILAVLLLAMPASAASGGCAAAPDGQADAETCIRSGYTVEFTLGGMQYVLPGGESVQLSEILNGVGLAGEPDAALSSAPDIFSVERKNGVWTVTSRKAFNTEETLTLVIGGREHVITVTDDNDIDQVNFIDRYSGNYVWMGSDKGSPIKWRIIGDSTYEYLLISADVLGGKMNWSDAKRFCEETVIYNYFSETEQSVIPSTFKQEPDDYKYSWAVGRSADLNSQTFMLSVAEAAYYLNSNAARLPGGWWLRTFDPDIDDYVTCVNDDGTMASEFLYIYTRDTEWLRGARPAFQLDRGRVLLESAAEGGKAGSLQGGGSFGTVSGPSGGGKNEVKLTLIDVDRGSGRFWFNANIEGRNSAAVTPGGTITVSYSGAAKSDQISALLCQGGRPMYYATTKQDAGGKWELKLPDGLQGAYTLKVFSEQLNGDRKTDYASPVSEIGLYLPQTVTYKVENGTWSDGSTGDKTESVLYGDKPSGVPTGMIAAEGYSGGAWNPDPARTTVVRPTTFTYTFEHAKYAVTVSGGTADRTEAGEGERITVTADEPEPGKRFKEWTGAEGLTFAEGSATDATAAFTMPARAVELAAVYEDLYAVTVSGGTADRTEAAEGERVTVTADEPEPGKRFKEWTGAEGLTFTEGSASTATAAFTMPARAAELAAVYEEIPKATVTVEFGAEHGAFAAERFGGIDGFTVSGTTLTYTVLTDMTIGSAKDVFSDAVTFPEVIDNGEMFLSNLALNPASYYGSLEEVNAENAAWEGQLMPLEGIRFYAQWEKPAGEVTVTITPPAAGTEISVTGSGLTRRTEPQVEASVTGHAKIDVYSGANWMNGDGSDLFTGTVSGGQEYLAHFCIIADYGYYFPTDAGGTGEGMSVTITNATESSVTSAGTNSMVAVSAKVAATGEPSETGSVFGVSPGVAAGVAAGVLVLAGAVFGIARNKKKKKAGA